MEPLSLDEVQRVAVIWIGRLGDFIITTPVLAAVRKRFPGARILLVVGDRGREAAELCPDVDEIRVLHKAHSPLANLNLAAVLASTRFDLLIDLNSAFSRAAAALTWITQARVKLGFEKPSGNRLFTHRLAAPSESEHMLDRYARLAALLDAPYDPALRLAIPAKRLAEARRLLLGLLPGLKPEERVVGIHPGNFKKFENRWPETRFVALTDRLAAVPGLRLLYLAGPGEEAPVAGIVSRLREPVPILGPQRLAAGAAALSLLDLLVVNATGTAHAAAAVGTPTFSFLSRYTKTVWMPRSGPHECVVSESWESCRDIPVEAAWAKLSSMLESVRGRPGRCK